MTSLHEGPSDDDDGFTLIELLVVVVILGILIAIAIPVYLNYRKSANDKAAQSDIRAAVTVLEQCFGDNNAYPAAATVAAAGTTGAVATACAGRTATVSAGTTVKWFPAGDSQSYIIGATNSSGSGKNYCYQSSVGGGVKDYATAVTAWRSSC